MKRLLIVLAAGLLILVGVAAPASAKQDPVFVRGGDLAGSANGMSFAPDGTLYVASVFGATITQVDPDSGEILSRLTATDGVLFPDDLVVAGDGTVYWTDIFLGTVFKKPVGQPAVPLLPPGELDSANPLALSDTGRLFAAGCYGPPPADNSFVEIDPVKGGIINTLFGPVAGCASNGMTWSAGSLYSPQPYLDSVLRVDPDTGERTEVTTGWPVPVGTAVDSQGALYAIAQGVGEVVRIDVANPDTANNRAVIAKIPVGWADNIAINADDRIFISSTSDSTIAEVLPSGELRTVVPGQFAIPLGASVIGDTVYTANFAQVVGFDRKTGEQTSVFRAPFGFGFPLVTSSIAWGDTLVLMSGITGQIVIWDPVTNVPLAEGPPLFPIDAQPFNGDLLVTTATGDIIRMADDLTPIDVVATVPGATGITARKGDVYVADGDDGTIVQIISDDAVLPTPVEVINNLVAPEGIDLKANTMYVVEGGTQELTSIHLKSGKRKTIATELGLQAPLAGPYGFLNTVTVDHNDIYLNADRANLIYKY